MGLHQRGGGGTVRSPKVELQVKCKSGSSPEGDTFSHSIKLKNYNELRLENFLVPRILVVVLVPDAVADWLEHGTEELVLRRCGYWASLRGMPPSLNAETQTIQVPRGQRFTVDALQQIMGRISHKGLP